MTDSICIYHGNCADGFTSAWVVRLALGKNADVEYFPGFYQTPPPDVTGKTVYMVDFSYKRPVMEQMLKTAKKIIHIDHHVSAIEDLASLKDPKLVKFYSPENTASGAMLTWRYFFPDIEEPEFIKHIDDRDRWQFKLHGTREIQANVFSYDYTFENWDMLVRQSLDEQIKEGAAIERKHHKDIRELMNVVVRRMNIAGYNVPVANIPYQMGSDMCHALAKNEPFAAYYYDKPDRREFGLRSAEDGLDVSKIAVIHGGGGHKHAAGFSVSFDVAKGFEV